MLSAPILRIAIQRKVSALPTPDLSDLRVALFSGNYNYTRDGANLSQNRLVGFLLACGAAVRVYSPVVDTPAFAPIGNLVGVPAVPIPGRPDYRIPVRVGRRIERDLRSFNPNFIHVAAPEVLGHWAVTYARQNDLPVLASVHTRFETYLGYYRLGFAEPVINAILRRFYQRCDAIVAPCESMADILRQRRANADIGIWPSGVDQEVFTPAARCLDWRRGLGIGDAEIVIGFLGRLVMEKGLDVFADTIDELARRGVRHRVLIVGDGPARKWLEKRLPSALFTGSLSGSELGRAVASMDIFLNPSVTETFGMVTLEAMASGLPVVGADSSGTSCLVRDGVTGRLIEPHSIPGFADALECYISDEGRRKCAGAAGTQAAQSYSWDAVNRALADNYRRVIEQRAGARCRAGALIAHIA